MRNNYQLKLMIVDDHIFIREGLKRLLAHYPSYEVVGEAQNGNEAYKLVDKMKPDIVIMDLSMPGMGGLEAIDKIVKYREKTNIIVLSMYDSITYAIRALDLGAKAYIHKSNIVDELIAGIETVINGNVYLSEVIARKIAKNQVYGIKHLIAQLNTKEFEIFRMLAEGYDLDDIGSFLNLSAKSIANYQSTIKRKLNVTSAVELVRYALLEGVIIG
jgi:DNA-binding NarL/FixJ family response regulator